ncbi:hypothetical protein RNJ44_02753 [Nakaseomyces bracarensis]|uniref:Protein transport protein SEC23 n=1 Tax=Nakaseomyces bracarensis TaxID=273131 RepID=A0ABR4P0I7_9SACH
MGLYLSQNWLAPGEKLYDLDGDSNVLYSVYEPFGSKDVDVVDVDDIEVCSKCRGRFRSGNPCPICNIATFGADADEDAKSSEYSYCVKEVNSPLEARIVIVDTICNEPEFGELKKKILDCMDQLDETPVLLISIHADGTVKVHGRDKTVSILVDQFRVSYALKHLDAKYFTKLLDGTSVLHSYRDHFTMQLIGLKPTSYVKNKKKRAKRATGFALFLASVLCESKKLNYQVMSFLSGPCTIGPGKVISRDVRNTIRNFNELESRKSKYFEDAFRFYQFLASAESTVRYTFVFASLNQVGIYEMSPMIRKSSILRQFDSFSDSIIDDTLEKCIIIKESNSIHNVKLRVHTSEGIEYKTSTAVPMSWNYLVNKNNVSLPIKFKITNHRLTNYMVQVVLEFNRDNKRICNVSNALITGERTADTDSGILLAGLAKEIAWNNMNERCYSRNTTGKYNTVLRKIAKGKKRKEDRQFLFLLYNLLRFGIMDVRNISPDQRITISHEVAYSCIEKVLLMIKPRVLRVSASVPEVEEIELSADLYDDDNAMLGIDAGNMFIIRESDRVDSLALRMKIDNWHKHREVDDLALIPLIRTKPGTGQDRYFKNKLIPISNNNAKKIHSEDITFEQFLDQLS